MSINIQPSVTADSTGVALVQAISPIGQAQVANDDDRRIQEILLLMQQANLLSTQLVNEKTARYTFMEIR